MLVAETEIEQPVQQVPVKLFFVIYIFVVVYILMPVFVAGTHSLCFCDLEGCVQEKACTRSDRLFISSTVPKYPKP